jgi:hypothetical protein
MNFGFPAATLKVCYGSDSSGSMVAPRNGRNRRISPNVIALVNSDEGLVT